MSNVQFDIIWPDGWVRHEGCPNAVEAGSSFAVHSTEFHQLRSPTMRQRESKLSTKIMGELRLRGVFCFKVHGSELMMAGLPDIVCCVRGRFVGLEVKMPESRGDVSKVQKLRAAQIAEAGGEAFVVCSVAEALVVVDRIIAST